MYHVIYYDENNKSPVVDFIQTQNAQEQAKILREIDLLEEFGLFLGMPHIRKIKSIKNNWELRIKHSSNLFRILFFTIKDVSLFYYMVFKKTNKTPKKELNIALKRMLNYIERGE